MSPRAILALAALLAPLLLLPSPALADADTGACAGQQTGSPCTRADGNAGTCTPDPLAAGVVSCEPIAAGSAGAAGGSGAAGSAGVAGVGGSVDNPNFQDGCATASGGGFSGLLALALAAALASRTRR